MLVIPAIDLREGRCVRLRQGRPDQEVVYAEDPVSVARQWAAEGAEYLHVVDLDGAFQGQPAHAGVIEAIAAAVDIPVQAGGGLRTGENVRRLLDAGVRRAVVGTRAAGDPEAVRDLVEEFGSRLAVGIDARGGVVQVRGWVESTRVGAVALARRMDALNVETLVYTEVSRDGMLEGVDAAAVDAVCAAVGCRVIAAGGISGVNDIRALRKLGRSNLEGVIVGKALYEGRARLADLLEEAME